MYWTVGPASKLNMLKRKCIYILSQFTRKSRYAANPIQFSFEFSDCYGNSIRNLLPRLYDSEIVICYFIEPYVLDFTTFPDFTRCSVFNGDEKYFWKIIYHFLSN